MQTGDDGPNSELHRQLIRATQNSPVLSTQNSQLLSTRRHIAIYVPVDCAAGFEKSFVVAFTIARFSRCRREIRGAREMTSTFSTESILIRGESNWIQTKSVIWLIWFVWFVLFVWLNETHQMNQINQINQTNGGKTACGERLYREA